MISANFNWIFNGEQCYTSSVQVYGSPADALDFLKELREKDFVIDTEDLLEIFWAQSMIFDAQYKPDYTYNIKIEDTIGGKRITELQILDYNQKSLYDGQIDEYVND